ncbi:MAG TPA: PilT/PilU family type 4a pilus ATPase [Terriglobales bacterium]|nr:PilT/PilU family type 4a pilus ATPase [Terriglobales bacterium]
MSEVLAPETAASSVIPNANVSPAAAAPKVIINTAALVTAMVSVKGASDLVFSPGRPPQVELHGRLTPVKIEGLPMLLPDHTAQIAKDLVAGDEHTQGVLKRTGSCDLSYSLPQRARFRVNVFRQRNTYAIVMRVIPHNIPTFEQLNLPPELKKIAQLKNGIVLVTGPTGSGKSSTLAAVVDLINSTRADHIVTIEDPIEFLHAHKMGTVHQRELHSDTDSFANALRSALRQAPKVILVGEMRDQDTIEIAMTAAETGHLVFSTLHTIDASKTVERIIGVFPAGDQQAVRTRLAASFRYFVSQRLLPRRDGKGRVAIIEILKSTLRTREYIEKGEAEGKSLLDAIRDGDMDGMQDFDGELERAVNLGVITKDDALHYATNAGNLNLRLSEVDDGEIPPAGAEVLYLDQMQEAVEVER